MNSGVVFVICIVVNQSGSSDVCSGDNVCTMRRDGKHLHIADNDSDQHNFSTDAEDQSSSVES